MSLEMDFCRVHLVTKIFLLFYMKIDIVNTFQLVTTNNTCTFSEKMTLLQFYIKSLLRAMAA